MNPNTVKKMQDRLLEWAEGAPAGDVHNYAMMLIGRTRGEQEVVVFDCGLFKHVTPTMIEDSACPPLLSLDGSLRRADDVEEPGTAREAGADAGARRPGGSRDLELPPPQPAAAARFLAAMPAGAWNEAYPPGSWVWYKTDAGERLAKTSSTAWLVAGRVPVVLIEGEGGAVPLSRLAPATLVAGADLRGGGSLES